MFINKPFFLGKLELLTLFKLNFSLSKINFKIDQGKETLKMISSSIALDVQKWNSPFVFLHN